MNSPPIGLTAPPTTSAAGLRRTMLVMLGLVSMFNYIDRTVLSVLQEPIKRELGLSDGQLGLLTGLAFALFYATLSVPLARRADRFNPPDTTQTERAEWRER